MSLFRIIFAIENGQEAASLGFALPSLWVRSAFALGSLCLHSAFAPKSGDKVELKRDEIDLIN